MPQNRSPFAGSTPVPRRAWASVLTAVLLAASATACTGDDPPPDQADPTITPTAQAPVTVSVNVERVAGALSKRARTRLGKDVRAALQGYVDAAFLGDYPRADGFESALASFTKGAAKVAQPDLELLSGAGLGEVASVTPKRLDVSLSALAARGRAVGATATVRFRFDVDGRGVAYEGRLMLTPDEGEWRIFGYDVRRNDKRDAMAGVPNEEDS